MYHKSHRSLLPRIQILTKLSRLFANLTIKFITVRFEMFITWLNIITCIDNNVITDTYFEVFHIIGSRSNNLYKMCLSCRSIYLVSMNACVTTRFYSVLLAC